MKYRTLPINNVEDIRLRKSGLVVFGEIIVETQGDVDLKKVEMLSDKIKCWDVIKNPAAALEKKKGVKTAEFLISRDVNVLIIHDIGEGPFHVLRDNFVKILQMPVAAKNVEDVIEKVPELNTITSPAEDRT